MFKKENDLIFETYAGVIPDDIKAVLDDPTSLNKKLQEYKADYGDTRMKGMMRNLLSMYPEQMAAAGAMRGGAYNEPQIDHETIEPTRPKRKVARQDLPSSIRQALDHPGALYSAVQEFRKTVGQPETLEVLNKIRQDHPDMYERMTKIAMARSRIPQREAYKRIMENADKGGRFYNPFLITEISTEEFSQKYKNADEVPTYCAWCKKHMKGEDIGYSEGSHGMCPECLEKMMSEVEAIH